MTTLAERIEFLYRYSEQSEPEHLQSILADVRELEAAAKPFAIDVHPDWGDSEMPWRFKARQFRALHAALTKTKGQP